MNIVVRKYKNRAMCVEFVNDKCVIVYCYELNNFNCFTLNFIIKFNAAYIY